MKKILMSSLLAILLTACGGEEKTNTAATAAPASTQIKASETDLAQLDAELEQMNKSTPINMGTITLDHVDRKDNLLSYQFTITDKNVTAESFSEKINNGEILQQGCASIQQIVEKGIDVNYIYSFSDGSKKEVFLSEAECAKLTAN